MVKVRKVNALQNLPDRKLNIRFYCLKVISFLPFCTLQVSISEEYVQHTVSRCMAFVLIAVCHEAALEKAVV